MNWVQASYSILQALRLEIDDNSDKDPNYDLLFSQTKPSAAVDLSKSVVLNRGQTVVFCNSLGAVQGSRERAWKDEVDFLVL